MKRLAITAMALLLLSGCMHELIHQGNQFKVDKINLIHEGDTKYSIEQTLGTPMLDSSLHPHRVTYYEEYEDENDGKVYMRGIEIIYDDALRAKSIRKFGFDKKIAHEKGWFK